MRKLTAVLLLLMILMLLPCAQAAELPYGESTVLSVLNLTASQRALVEYLYTPLFNGESEIDLPRNTLYDDASAAMEALMQDYPELFHVGRKYTLRYYQNTPEYAASVVPQYIMSASEAASLRSRLYQQCTLLIDSADSVEDLHDLLLPRVIYGGDEQLRHTAVGALIYGQATCEGYAQAMSLIHRMAGIPCGIIVGTAVDSTGSTERHSWNILYVGGYTLVDATWNDQDHMGMNTHWYYGLSTAQMGLDHYPDSNQTIPSCGDQINWHRSRGGLISTREQADAAIARLVSGQVVNLRVTSASLYAALADTNTYLNDYNARNPASGFYGSYSFTKSDAQQCLIIFRTN